MRKTNTNKDVQKQGQEIIQRELGGFSVVPPPHIRISQLSNARHTSLDTDFSLLLQQTTLFQQQQTGYPLKIDGLSFAFPRSFQHQTQTQTQVNMYNIKNKRPQQ
jgi:hypothetical protein